jgi:putative heme degradation protein
MMVKYANEKVCKTIELLKDLCKIIASNKNSSAVHEQSFGFAGVDGSGYCSFDC